MVGGLMGGIFGIGQGAIGAAPDYAYQNALSQLGGGGGYSNALPTAPQMTKQDVIDAIRQVQQADEHNKRVAEFAANYIPPRVTAAPSHNKKLLLLA